MRNIWQKKIRNLINLLEEEREKFLCDADAHSRRNYGRGTEGYAGRGENKVEALADSMGIRRNLEVLAIFLRLVH